MKELFSYIYGIVTGIKPRIYPQNMSKRSLPAAMLKSLNLRDSDLIWIMGNPGQYLGFAVTDALKSSERFQSWISNKNLVELDEHPDGYTIYIYKSYTE